MTEFSHCEVLFAGDDGLPMQFNIQNTTEKEYLKALIEHGGGICTLSGEAIILVSPGTKVLNVPANKSLISSRYIFDCVKDDCLLDTDEYKIEINEIEVGDFSDSSNLQVNSHALDSNKNFLCDPIEDSIDLIQSNKIVPQNMPYPNSNHDFDFQCTESRSIPVAEILQTHNDEQQNSHIEFPLQSSENHIHFGLCVDKVNNFHNSVAAASGNLKKFQQSVHIQEKKNNEQFKATHIQATSNDENPVAVVSSSQENQGALDQFDNMILNKVQEKPKMDEDSLSQSYTVSSSADAQISPNQPPSHHTSAELFDGSPAAPDSASQSTERQLYINNLEKEIEQILQKPSPKSIQDKTILVKYICTVKKLAPAIVLQTLQRF